MLNSFGTRLGETAAQNKQTFEAAQAALVKEWGDDYQKEIGNANLAKRAYFDDDMKKELERQNLDNNTVVLKLLAKVGRELNDDKLPSTMQAAELDSIDSLRNSEAYRNPRHAEHRSTVAKVNAAYEAGYKARD